MREVRISDTLSGKTRALEPRDPPRVGIYTCGPTVYSRVHVGNARPFVIPILLRRLLRRLGYEPRLVINVTDINDKIYDAAREAGVPSDALAREMTRAYVEDTDRLDLGRPDAEPLASETIAEIIELIEALIESGHAYESGGDVYYRVRSFPDYGKLSNRDPAEMDQGEEAGTASLKEDPLDFALWKAHKTDEDTSWPSPWGEGRPGWHIECSAMGEKLLGTDFDIHGGGVDLVFPHHENEIAQTEAARGVPLARLWMHNGMIRVADEKMSKSVGNIFQLSEALDRYGRDAVVAYLISGHYHQPLEFSDRALTEADARVKGIRNFVLELPESDDREPDPAVTAWRSEFLDALADDFNTPRALAILSELITEGNRHELPGARAALEEMLPLLGLESLLAPAETADPEAERLLAEREEARAARDFELADRLRDELAERGFEVRDTPGGARLMRRRG
ncbi:MAG TPA: cysteine--tRNA ligase [Solirubrobacterales bacterium]|nr:cysteine--tRNA ligase [Solirubrobacterales bacterium]